MLMCAPSSFDMSASEISKSSLLSTEQAMNRMVAFVAFVGCFIINHVLFRLPVSWYQLTAYAYFTNCQLSCNFTLLRNNGEYITITCLQSNSKQQSSVLQCDRCDSPKFLLTVSPVPNRCFFWPSSLSLLFSCHQQSFEQFLGSLKLLPHRADKEILIRTFRAQ